MSRIPFLLAAGLVAGLAACTSKVADGEAAEEEVAAIAVPAEGDDACQATNWQKVVGQSVAVLNSADLPDGTRVLFPGIEMTEDFSAERLNIEVGTSDQVTRVFCG